MWFCSVLSFLLLSGLFLMNSSSYVGTGFSCPVPKLLQVAVRILLARRTSAPLMWWQQLSVQQKPFCWQYCRRALFEKRGARGSQQRWAAHCPRGMTPCMPIKALVVAVGQDPLSTAQSASTPGDAVIVTVQLWIQSKISCCNIFSGFDLCQ